MSTSSPFLSLAIVCLTGHLVPHVAIHITEYRLTTAASWPEHRVDAGERVITRQATLAIVVAAVIYIATAIGVALSTRIMDLRAMQVMFGLSLFTSAVVLFLLSFNVPKWLGIYFSVKSDFGSPVGRTLKHLSFNVRWSTWREFGKIYFIIMFFFCGAHPVTIPVSMLLGLLFGGALFYGVYIGRTRFKHRKRTVAFILVGILSLCSAGSFAWGSWYINEVWGATNWQNVTALTVSCFFIWLAMETIWHYVVYHRSVASFALREALQRDGVAAKSLKYKTNLFKPGTFKDIQREEKERHQASMEQIAEEDEDVEAEQPIAEADEANDNNKSKDDGEDGADEEVDRNETTCSLLLLHCCGRGALAGERPIKTPFQKFICLVRWIIWIGVSVLFLYVTIINIGASQQTTIVMAHLPASDARLYPPDYNTGVMCAWNHQGENSTIQTFQTRAEALAANMSVVHCGACGACSNWNDLRLQWTTRDVLAKKAQKCGAKSISGGIEKVQECNHEDIGFTTPCAWCWTHDEICAKSHCVFIFLQSAMVNRLTVFNVGENHITSASCDEAMCGPTFLPCVGANRRRMGIVSAIPRPAWQQCTAAKEDWAKVFNSP